ncbi:hypothetical protein DsansV1_C04g0037211 [Dioscorea sansibarensis]
MIVLMVVEDQSSCATSFKVEPSIVHHERRSFFSFGCKDITSMATTLPRDSNTSSVMQENTYQRPITNSHIKQIQNQVNANLSLLSYYIDMTVLPISST